MARFREVGLMVALHNVEGPFDGYVFTEHMANNGCQLNRKLAVVKVATNPSDGIGIVVGGKSYLFRTTPSLAADVKIGATKAETIQNLLFKINTDKAVTLCTGYTGENSIGDADSFVLITNDVGITATLTVDGTQIVKTIDWTLALSQAQLDNVALFAY